MKTIVDTLIKRKETISTMESCTGGKIADAITSCPGSSEIFKFGAVTYSNEYKVKMGVPSEIIEKYTVYSMETANAMSKAISTFTNSTYGIGITGQLKRIDPNNIVNNSDMVYISIYNKNNDSYTTATVQVDKDTRPENKELVLSIIKSMLKKMFDND